MNALSPDEIKSIVAWYRGGNKPRAVNFCRPCPEYTQPAINGGAILNPVGITLAKMAIALEHSTRLVERSFWDE